MTQRTDTSLWPCAIARSVATLGDGWTLVILRDACLGARRFSEFQERLQIGRKVLTDRLHQMVDDGLLLRVPYSEHPPRSEYRLTDKGRDAYPILAAMAAWHDRWSETQPSGSTLQLHHTSCGHDMSAAVVCSSCHSPIHVRDVRAGPGPGFADAALEASKVGAPLPVFPTE